MLMTATRAPFPRYVARGRTRSRSSADDEHKVDGVYVIDPFVDGDP